MTNLKKGLFELHIIGDPSKKKVLLIHGMGFQWKFCFKKVIEELKRNYCLILPELGGHNMQGLGGFSNVYECADEIITSIRNHRIEELDCIYGISLGASIAIEIALRDCIRPLINDFLRKMAKFRHQENQDVSAGTRIRFFIDKPAAMISFPRAVIKYL